MRFFLWRKRRSAISGVSSLLLLLLLVTACGNSGGPTPGSSVNAQGTARVTSVTPTQSAALPNGAQPCPTGISAPAYWGSVVPTQPNINAVESVSCAYLMGIPRLQAVVLVRAAGSGAALDVRVYDNITSPAPQRIFLLRGLVHGNAKVSIYNTIMTAEVDTNEDTFTTQPDLFREFKWSDGAGTLVPIAFPGIFPDLTRYESENDQQAAGQGQNGWMLDATQTAQHFVATRQLLDWSLNSQVTITSGGGKNDLAATVTVKNTYAATDVIKLTMSRLEGNTGGIWIITGAASDGLTLTSPQNLDIISSPVAAKGSGSAFEGVVGQLLVLDHLYQRIGKAEADGGGNGNTSFSASIPYTSTFNTGLQDGLVVLDSYSNVNGTIAGAVFVKALIH